MNDETMIEMAEAHFACGCDTCAMQDDAIAFLIAELSWEEMGL